jgi:hypothetical protein
VADRRRALTLGELEGLIAAVRKDGGRHGVAAGVYEAEAEDDRKRASRKDELAAWARKREDELTKLARVLEQRRLAIRPKPGRAPVDIGQEKLDHVRALFAEDPTRSEAELARLAGTNRYRVRQALSRRTDYRAVDKPVSNANRGGPG